MISSTSSSSGAARPDLNVTSGPATPRPITLRDQLSTQNAAFLNAQLQQQPEIRPEVVARARLLAADPSYPPASVIQKVASQILASPDLSEVAD
jgi:hypothetical protein